MKKYVFIMFLVFVFVFVLPGGVFALENFTFLSKGAPELNFGSISTTTYKGEESAVINVLKSGTKYSFKIRFSGYFINDEGRRISANVFKMKVSGTFSGETEFYSYKELTRREKEFFVSDEKGTAEQLNLNFIIEFPSDILAGNYEGVINIKYYENGIEIEDEEIPVKFTIPQYFTISLKNPNGSISNKIEFKPLLDFNGITTEERILSISSNVGKRYKVEQVVKTNFVNSRNGQESEKLDFMKFIVSTSGVKGQVYSTGKNAVSYTPQLIYISDSSGTPVDLKIFYYLENTPSLLYGEYNATIQFKVIPYDNAADFIPKELDIQIYFEVKKVLSVKAEVMDSRISRLDFGFIPKNSTMKIMGMKVYVFSNVGVPYMVYHEFLHPLINTKGVVFRNDNLFIKVDDGKKGKSLIKKFEKLPFERIAIFRSDENGSSDVFTVYYGIEGGKGSIGGKYSSGIKLSAEEIIK